MSAPKVKITFNGKILETDPGTPLLQAAIDAGEEVPHFCYHPGIGVEGSCRLCLVEVAGMPKLQTSCTVPVKEGMVVSSVSEQVKKARKGVLEFFLLNHPLDCPICDKGGECPLQNYSLDAGQSQSRMAFDKIHKDKHQVIGDHIILDKERCVLCDRCVRFMRNFAGKEELQIRQRGSHSEIFVPDGTSLTTGFTGNLADMCPVGALTSREFRFRARPWEMTTIDTVCGECSLGCSSQVWRKKPEILRMTPRVEPEVNEWWLCDRGRYSIKPNLEGERLKLPIKPGNGLDMKESAMVVAALAQEIRNVPQGAMAFVADSTLTNEEFYRMRLLAKDVGRGRVFVPVEPSVLRLLQKLRDLGLEAPGPGAMEKAKQIVVIGEVMETAHPVLALRLRRLYYARNAEIHTVGDSKMGFEDVFARHHDVKKADLGAFVSHQLNSILKDGPAVVLISDQWVTEELVSNLENISKSWASKVSASLLLTGANLRGMLDQWGENVRPLVELETEINHGRVEGILWFGKAPSSPVFDEYFKGMRLFGQFVNRASEAHPKAKWILPLDSFFEKKGTYTNTFGHVAILRRTIRIIEKGYEPLEFLSLLRAQFGAKDVADVAQLYSDLAQGIQRYPREVGEIRESQQTYTHYQRAQWR